MRANCPPFPLGMRIECDAKVAQPRAVVLTPHVLDIPMFIEKRPRLLTDQNIGHALLLQQGFVLSGPWIVQRAAFMLNMVAGMQFIKEAPLHQLVCEIGLAHQIVYPSFDFRVICLESAQARLLQIVVLMV